MDGSIPWKQYNFLMFSEFQAEIHTSDSTWIPGKLSY